MSRARSSERVYFAFAGALLLAAPLLILNVAIDRSFRPRLTDRPVPASSVVAQAAPGRILRVCADPNNLPFSNDREEGFENALAHLVARELGARIEYLWKPQRRGFVRTTLSADLCDVMMEAPAEFDRVLPTSPYYRSTYVFVTRRDSPFRVRSLDDPLLRDLRIGVQIVGDDYANTPPAEALARRGLADRISGYSLYGDYSVPDPPARIVDAVARGEIDVAVVWGPLAGFFARHQCVPLVLSPVGPEAGPVDRFSFDIAMGVKKGNTALRDELNGVIVRRRAEIDALLDDYGVPRAPLRLDAAARR